MTNFKGTTGKAIIATGTTQGTNQCMPNNSVFINSMRVCQSFGETKEQATENNLLVKDAFNVRQQINFDLPELLKQRNEMLESIKELVSYLEAMHGAEDTECIEMKFAKKLIKKAKGV